MNSCLKSHSGLKKILFLAISTLFCIFLLTNTVEIPIEVQWKSTIDNRPQTANDTHTKVDAFDECVLKVYDPFYKEIKKVISHRDPLKGCNTKFLSPTRLIEGKVSIHPEREKEYDSCSASCLEYVNAIKTKQGIWRNFTQGDELAMNCDFIYTRCFKNNTNVDEFVHMQIKEVNERVNPSPFPSMPPKSNILRPDVYMIVIDSVSSTQALRSLPKTMEFMKRNMSGVFFNHLNKVGENTQPNAYALTLGWRIMNSNRLAIGADNLPPQVELETVCRKYRDNDSTIFNQYKDAGYKTAWIEDWPDGDFYSYPDCKGTAKQHAMHTLRPLVVITKEKSLRKNYHAANCFEPTKDVLDYSGMFVKAYKNQPKFALSWMATIAHDDANLLFHTDEYFEKFFKDNESVLRNSFVFFMGDHGIRWGTNLGTELGKREANNPFLMVTVPQFLRRNDKFMANLEENSMKLVTQYDVHATLIDISKHAPQSNFTNFDFKTIFEENPNNATSLIRPLGPFSRRNCKNIPVPFQFCLCEYNMEEINSPTSQTVAHQLLVNHINNLIGEHNATDLCPKLEPDKITTWPTEPEFKPYRQQSDVWNVLRGVLSVLSMKAYAPEAVYRLYEVIFRTKPGGGEFKGHLHYDVGTKQFQLQAKIERINAYGHAGDCVKKDLDIRKFCYCKTQEKS